MKPPAGFVPNLEKPSHLDAVDFKATAEFAGNLFLRVQRLLDRFDRQE
jgi:hypothetical protein